MPTSPSHARRQGREDACPDVPPAKKYSFSHLQEAYEQSYLEEAHRIEQRQKELIDNELAEEREREEKKQELAELLEEVLDIDVFESEGAIVFSVMANGKVIKAKRFRLK